MRDPARGKKHKNYCMANLHSTDTSRFRVPVVGALYSYWIRARRLTDAVAWTARLLRLPTFEEPHATGLVLVQIDGFSRVEFERALTARQMPYLARLLDREGYRPHWLYSGLPSTTPAVQGELFYGHKTAVPAFAFGNRERGKVVNMLDPDVVCRIEDRLATESEGTLTGGSSYCNIYRGGAREPHFSAATMGWNEMFRDVRPWAWVLILLWNLGGLCRIAGKLLVETVLIAGDLLLGLLGRRDLKREWEFVPSRLGVGVLLEELMTMAACVDAARGLPTVQFNFLSFDERSHLRGPSSRFAHQALRRIDKAIARVARAAHRSQARHYAVWVYSDHGHEATTPYDDIAGGTFVAAVAAACQSDKEPITHQGRSGASTRYRYLRKRCSIAPARAESPRDPVTDELMVAAIGPVGHIYFPHDTTSEAVEQACRALCAEHKVPLVLRRRSDGDLDVWAADGVGRWLADPGRWLGSDHPFLSAITQDMVGLCTHPDAGDIVTLGWRAGLAPISFVREYGAHGGAGPCETGAFALVPHEAPLEPADELLLRPSDLRNAVGKFLSSSRESQHRQASRQATKTLRVVSYNVHSCVGLDGRLSPARIARVLARCDADIVALQELDVRRARTEHVDQVGVLAELLGMEDYHFYPAVRVETEHYGDAILSRLPLRLVRAETLPGTESRPFLEPRGAIWAVADWNGQQIQIVNTHLGLLPAERSVQVDALLGADWLGHAACRDPVLFCGDFNFGPNSATFRRIVTEFADCQRACRPQKTWFGPWPLARIDHLFVRGSLKVVRVNVPRTPLTVVASDHLPLVVDLEWGETL